MRGVSSQRQWGRKEERKGEGREAMGKRGGEQTTPEGEKEEEGEGRGEGGGGEGSKGAVG